MSFDTYDSSVSLGRPVRLYEFSMGPIKWTYTSSDTDITALGLAYASTAGLSDDGIRQTGDTSADMLSITCPRVLAIVNLFIGVPTSNPVTLTVRDLHRDDVDAEAKIVWVGTVKSGKLVGADRAVLKAQPLIADLERTGLRLSWGRSCPHALYDKMCTVAPALFQDVGIIASMDGASISSGVLGSHGEGYFSGGFIAWEIDLGVLERRGIDQQVGSTVTLLGGSSGLTLGQEFFAYPGCQRTVADCTSKFNNFPNYGGIPRLPGTSPFNGEPLY